MFAVKEMCECCLSNTAYPTKTEVDVQTGKKRTVINTDLFVIKEWTITHKEFIKCYKGLMHVYEEVFPSSVFGDFCQYQCHLLLHEYFDCPNLFNVIVHFDSYICCTWLEPHGRFVMDSDDMFFIMDQFDHEVKEENDEWMHKQLDAADYASGSHREHQGNQQPFRRLWNDWSRSSTTEHVPPSRGSGVSLITPLLSGFSCSGCSTTPTSSLGSHMILSLQKSELNSNLQ
jgi:hypothetical protein